MPTKPHKEEWGVVFAKASQIIGTKNGNTSRNKAKKRGNTKTETAEDLRQGPGKEKKITESAET